MIANSGRDELRITPHSRIGPDGPRPARCIFIEAVSADNPALAKSTTRQVDRCAGSTVALSQRGFVNAITLWEIDEETIYCEGKLMGEIERKKKLQNLLERHKQKIQVKETSSLFNECIAELGEDTIIFSKEKSAEIYKSFENEFKITFYGRVEWTLCEYEELDLYTLRTTYANKDENYNILWSHGSDPVIQASIKKVLEHLDDVTAVSPDIWLYKENECMIEIFHDGIIRRTDKKNL